MSNFPASLQRIAAPLPSALPTLGRDSQLSCVSLMDRDLPHHSLSSSVLLSGNVGSAHSGAEPSPSPPPTATPPLSSPSAVTVFPEKQREPHTFEPEVLLRQQEQQLHRVQLQVIIIGQVPLQVLTCVLYLQLSQLLALHTPTTSEAGTNTGVSLLLPK